MAVILSVCEHGATAGWCCGWPGEKETSKIKMYQEEQNKDFLTILYFFSVS